MNIIIARNSGFCGGVRRAMRLALAAADAHGSLAAEGPLVHNNQALELLSLRGIRSDDASDPTLPVLVRAHGVAPQLRDEWDRAGRIVIDATCPHVAANQRLAAEAAAGGATVVLAGDRDHAEVRAVAASADGRCIVVSRPEDIDNLDIGGDAILMAQTTFNVALFSALAEAMRRRFPHCRVVDTICRATHNRQEEATRLARLADVLVVVGGRHSANTRRLADAAAAAGKPAILVETAAELRPGDFASFATAAVISGASTPGWTTQDVIDRLRSFGKVTPQSALARALAFLVRFRLSTALSAGGFSLAACYAMLGEVVPAATTAGACFALFAHILNRRIPPDREALRLSLVDAFYQTRRRVMLPLAWLAAAVSLVAAAALGGKTFLLYALSMSGAALYAAARRRELLAKGRARRASLARNWITAGGWALTLALPPFFLGAGGGACIAAILFIFANNLAGTLIRDLHDIASDRLIGIDTLTSRIGEARARALIAGILGAAAIAPLVAGAAALLSGRELAAFVPALAVVPAIGLALRRLVDKHLINDGVMLQAGVDAMGVAAGALVLLFQALGNP